MPTNGMNGHAAATAIPAAVPVPTRSEGSQPILPPRTTARSVPVARPHSVWRSWPMLVIILAGIAIVTATVIMVMPAGTKKDRGNMSAPPAPERMETNPLPDKQSQVDPWDNGTPGSIPRAPDPRPQAPAPVDPDDDDLWSGPGGGLGGGTPGGTLGGGGTFGGSGDFMVTVLDHACTKLKSCPDADQFTLTAVCDAVSMMPKPRAPTNCAAAQKCLDTIDHMSCDTAAQASPQTLMTTINDCTIAATKC